MSNIGKDRLIMENNNLKNNWKKVGKDFASLGKDLGTTLAKTVRKGVNIATEWANDDDKKKEESGEKKEED